MTDRHRILVLAVAFLLAVGTAPTATLAQGESSLTGSFLVGYRSVDVSGTTTKFAEDLNYDDGPRLFRLEFDFVPDENLRSAVDRIRLDVNDFGGDPYETLRLEVAKNGRYELDYRRTKSDYFYHDIILPVEEAGDPALALAGDFHTFDFERVQDRADLTFWVNDRARLLFGFDRFTKRGESTTTLDISRDEFELDKPIDESLNGWSAAFEYSWDKVTLTLEESYRDYENIVEIFAPGQSLGEDPENETILDFFFLDQPYDYSALRSRVTLAARPNERLNVVVSGVLEDLDLDVEAEESSQGIDFTGQPFTIEATGEGDINRDLELFDIDLSYLVTDHFALTGSVRQYNLDQDGELVFGGEPNDGMYEIDTTSIEAGVEWLPSREITVAVGVIEESRDVDLLTFFEGEELKNETAKTDQTGYYGRFNWRPNRTFQLSASLEDASIDDPFALTAPTDRSRYRLQGRVNLENGFWASGNYILAEYENGLNGADGWEADSDQLGVRAGYRKDGLDLGFGYQIHDVDRAVDQVVTTAPGFGGGQVFDFPVFYESEATFWDGRVRYVASQRLTVGADARFYDNDGSFGLSRDDLRAYADIAVMGSYILHLGYRTIDYDEDEVDFDDYDADIIELGLGYRW